MLNSFCDNLFFHTYLSQQFNPAMLTPQQFIQHYSLQPHPEGGWYCQTYRSEGIIPAAALPSSFGGDRLFSTAIYFLLEEGNFSAFHRIKSDECWHFYAGQPLHIYVIRKDGILETVILGNDSTRGELFQYVVPAGCWFASRPAPGSAFAFVGCTVSPGFDFADFELANATALSIEYPAHEKIIRSLCR
ncbi:MAG: cupin domain-containing protein [Chitinophagaceae bacterium]|nr:cupin domain-containing protein [Chitinophagaceae bacterium]